jgi:hypothetical protein
MGGGGGGYWSSSSHSEGPNTGTDKAVSDAASASSYDAAANAYMQDLLSDYNKRDADAVRKNIDTLQQIVESDSEGKTDTLFGGSVRKHTYVDGLSDIDVLMVMNKSSLANATPAEVLGYLEQRFSERLNSLGVKVKAGDLAVTVRYSDGTEIQVLPALRTATGVRIATTDGGWSSVVRPQAFAKKLTDVNKAQNGRVVPVIKLFKGLQTRLPQNDQLKGYHIESLAIEAFRSYAGRQSLKDMLHHFVEFASTRVQQPVRDTTGQSLHVDDYLGDHGSKERQRVASSLGRLAQRLETAEKRSSIDDLRTIFGE